MPKPSVASLRVAIRDITGRMPESIDPDYLRRRLAELKRSEPSTTTTIATSIALTKDARDATHRIAARENTTVSKLIRRALAEYASRHSYTSEANILKEGL